MRIWDIHPAYLNRQSLLGEHRELHGIVSIILHGKKGYANHPETKRWVDYGWALRQRHKLLASEMALRGFTDKSPVTMNSNPNLWPEIYIDTPNLQFQLLKNKYRNKEQGRIPLPENPQQLWHHHQYSVLARDAKLYQEIGRDLCKAKIDFYELAMLVTKILRQQPSNDGVKRAIQHMWRDIPDKEVDNAFDIDSRSPHNWLLAIQKMATTQNIPQLTTTTSLSELIAWL